MFRARWAYFRVLRVSSKSISAQLTQAIITLAAAACGAGEEIDPRSPTSGPAQAKPSPVAVREFPPKLSCRSLVNLDSRYGTWLPAEDVRRVTNRPSQKGKNKQGRLCALHRSCLSNTPCLFRLHGSGPEQGVNQTPVRFRCDRIRPLQTSNHPHSTTPTSLPATRRPRLAGSPRAEMTFPRANNPELIDTLSLKRLPTAPVPRSTRWERIHRTGHRCRNGGQLVIPWLWSIHLCVSNQLFTQTKVVRLY